MKLKFISEHTLQDLKINNDAYIERYYTEDFKWFDQYFIEEGKVLNSNFEFDMPMFSYHKDYAISDRENVKAVYKALQHLPVAQATQERFWAGLAHLQFRDFTFYRLKKDIEDKNDKRILSSLFFTHSAKRSLFVHILARLWWVGYMTYDENNKENPFWLTDFFTERDFSARSTVFFSSNFTSNRDITVGILRAIYKLKRQGEDIKRNHFVQASKYLNVVGGAMILDMLDADEVEEMVTKHLCKLFNINLQEKVEV
jgi:hypothetical protein